MVSCHLQIGNERRRQFIREAPGNGIDIVVFERELQDRAVRLRRITKGIARESAGEADRKAIELLRHAEHLPDRRVERPDW